MTLRFIHGGLLLVGVLVCGLSSARAEAAQVDCDSDFGHCEVSNEPFSSSWCSCESETEGTSGGDEFAGMSEEELLEVCNSMLESCAELSDTAGDCPGAGETSESGGLDESDSSSDSGESGGDDGEDAGTTVHEDVGDGLGDDAAEEAAEEDAGELVDRAQGCSTSDVSSFGAPMLLGMLALFGVRRRRVA